MAAESFAADRAGWRAPSDAAGLLWLAPAAFYYAFLLSAGASGLPAPVTHGLTFNSMLLHLLEGRFDVDPTAVGDEGYLRDGAVYAYFGVFPALFRAVFLWLPGFATTDFTRIACLVAVAGMALFKLLSLRLVWEHAGGPAAARPLKLLLTLAIVAGGPQIQFLRPTIFQEVELWAGAISAAFVFLTLRGLLSGEGFTPRLLRWMALAAGLCLSTRVSNAIGLYAATGLVWLWVAWKGAPHPGPLPAGAERERAGMAALALPLLILAVFAAATGIVNYGRWGNPLVFVDFARSLILPQYPDRLPRLEQYGSFSLNRVGFGLGYYFLPLWAFRDGAGELIWSGFEAGFTQCCVELPPSSFFISDPLLLGLAAYGLASLRRVARSGLAAAAGLGLVIPAGLMLTAFSMTFRYRMEFYPVFELFAFLGAARVVAAPSPRRRALVGAAAIIGILAAHATWVLYMLSPLGPAGRLLGTMSIGEFYASLFR